MYLLVSTATVSVHRSNAYSHTLDSMTYHTYSADSKINTIDVKMAIFCMVQWAAQAVLFMSLVLEALVNS